MFRLEMWNQNGNIKKNARLIALLLTCSRLSVSVVDRKSGRGTISSIDREPGTGYLTSCEVTLITQDATKSVNPSIAKELLVKKRASVSEIALYFNIGKHNSYIDLYQFKTRQDAAPP